MKPDPEIVVRTMPDIEKSGVFYTEKIITFKTAKVNLEDAIAHLYMHSGNEQAVVVICSARGPQGGWSVKYTTSVGMVQRMHLRRTLHSGECMTPQQAAAHKVLKS